MPAGEQGKPFLTPKNIFIISGIFATGITYWFSLKPYLQRKREERLRDEAYAWIAHNKPEWSIKKEE